MPNLLVKEIGADLLREVNYAASGEGMTQREWVLKVLVKAVQGGGTADARPIEGRVAGAVVEGKARGGRHVSTSRSGEAPGSTVGSNPTPATKIDQVPIPGMKCQFCSWGVYEFKDPNTGAIRLKCLGPKVHTMSKPSTKETQ